MKNKSNDEQIAKEILESYKGGMGSFLDLVLHKNMKMLKKENIELEEYREKLFQICEKILGDDYFG